MKGCVARPGQLVLRIYNPGKLTIMALWFELFWKVDLGSLVTSRLMMGSVAFFQTLFWVSFLPSKKKLLCIPRKLLQQNKTHANIVV